MNKLNMQSQTTYQGDLAEDEMDPTLLSRPKFHQRNPEIQAFGTVLRYPLALDGKIRLESVGVLNQVLVDTMVLRDLYKKHH